MYKADEIVQATGVSQSFIFYSAQMVLHFTPDVLHVFLNVPGKHT